MNSNTITVERHKYWRYEEVWRITKLKDNCIYKTEPTGFCVEVSQEDAELLKDYPKLASLGYLTVSLSIIPAKTEIQVSTLKEIMTHYPKLI